MAYEALERRIGNDAPTVLVARAGIDPVPYIARAHLTGPRKNGPLVVVDGTSSRDHELDRWTDEHTSPLALADGGLLLLVDGAALPREVQLVIARTIAERRPPWERPNALDVGLALSTTRPIAELLEPELAARFEDAEAIVLPGLHERAEDLRSIVADRLAREGLRVRGRPVGLDAGAFARLMDHAFPGEDAELAAIVTRLVANAREDVIRAADVDALALPASVEPEVVRWPEGARAANRRD
jgi:DNA-binding NtrC family response regulator